MEEVIIHSFYARVICFVIEHVTGSFYPPNIEQLSTRLGGLSPAQFQSCLDAVYQQLFSADARAQSQDLPYEAEMQTLRNWLSPTAYKTISETIPPKTFKKYAGSSLPQKRLGEIERINHLRFISIVEAYLTLRYAIKFGDIGQLRRALAQYAIIFAGAKRD
ncbi:hypothetical protein P152DRAFT_9643 [Eremomyces bilateralis CBS 781.70]|uniref:DUF6589 domain-containing protein n=1 Tax=Eremomyces bilateralis CBS 781.70 TaxID=1392243 RepID=A0A6G1GGN1_9PEZI|nr:uncharacterized protein P152DRAFT_9643 [Eremomyces bilateralis CBS 781.70]KAF1817152.1 hypothetical protein P152DRAFT_9643 [Eremomyces bilateralis CBS 781.70]